MKAQETSLSYKQKENENYVAHLNLLFLLLNISVSYWLLSLPPKAQWAKRCNLSVLISRRIHFVPQLRHSALSLLTCHSAIRFISSSGPLAALVQLPLDSTEGVREVGGEVDR